MGGGAPRIAPARPRIPQVSPQGTEKPAHPPHKAGETPHRPAHHRATRRDCPVHDTGTMDSIPPRTGPMVPAFLLKSATETENSAALFSYSAALLDGKHGGLTKPMRIYRKERRGKPSIQAAHRLLQPHHRKRIAPATQKPRKNFHIRRNTH